MLATTHVEVKQQYEQLRQEALKAATELIQGQGSNNIKLRTIDTAALNASRLWGQSTSIRQIGWAWFEEMYRFSQFHHPKRFEIAVWEKENLIGLSLGRPEYHGMFLKLNFIEYLSEDLGHFGDKRATIIKYILLAYDTYARLINAKQIRILSPDNAAISYYEKFGFHYFASEDFLSRNIF